MTIHREGRTLLIVLIVILSTIVFAVSKITESEIAVNVLIIISVIFYLIVLQFFRSPFRSIEINPNHIIAPADGKVVVIEETTETEYLKDKRIQVSIFMSPVKIGRAHV